MATKLIHDALNSGATTTRREEDGGEGGRLFLRRSRSGGGGNLPEAINDSVSQMGGTYVNLVHHPRNGSAQLHTEQNVQLITILISDISIRLPIPIASACQMFFFRRYGPGLTSHAAKIMLGSLVTALPTFDLQKSEQPIIQN